MPAITIKVVMPTEEQVKQVTELLMDKYNRMPITPDALQLFRMDAAGMLGDILVSDVIVSD